MKLTFKTISCVVALFFAGNSFLSANPTGMTVVSGSATPPQQNGSQLTITTGQSAFLNWISFDIQAGETTTFIQPSANSVVINAIGSANPSQIFGNLNANGTVILANANGFYFGPNSMIKVGGSFIATTAPLTPDFGAGSAWQFTGMPPLKSIVNYGQIQVGSGKSLFLIAEQIDNEGQLSAPGGNVGLAAGQSVLVSDRPDGRGLSATVTLPSGSVNNSGQINADAGTIALQAQLVNQNGTIQADSIQSQNGEIELVASSQLTLGANSQILARGDDASSGSSGGNITLKSGSSFSDSTGSQIVTSGGALGGNGGNVEINAPNVSVMNSTIDSGAQAGWAGGQFYLGLMNLVLGNTAGAVPDPNGTINAIDGTGTTYVNVGTAFKNITAGQILLEASGNISLAANTTWNLTASTGNQLGGQLTLEAGGDILFGNGSKITDANNWSVSLQAGFNFVNNAVEPGVGNIYLNNNNGGSTGGGWLQTAAGNINLLAGQNILIGSGSVTTTGGGNIFAEALAGNINAGSFNGGTSFTATPTSDWRFTSAGTIPNAVLGGFSTAAGGDVTLIAGNNIDSSPTVPSKQFPGASGAYGSGNVTVIAGNEITGNYTLANGVGTMLAGVQVSGEQASQLQNPLANPSAYAATVQNLQTETMQSQNPNGNIGSVASGSLQAVTLGLISGSWNAWAANNIYLKEVNNPNGTFNSAQSFQFNYALDAAANFWAGNAIELAGANLARVLQQNLSMLPIYAPILTLNAGAGGITIDTSIFLYPSSGGSLQITTRDGGNLVGSAQSTTLTGITMSDAGLPTAAELYEFKAIQNNDHANSPLHANDPNPVILDISGSIGSFGLVVPTFAQITVQGAKPFVTPDGQNIFGTYNFGFLGQNLSPAQITTINVTGDITYRGDLTSIPSSGQLAEPLPVFLFNPTLSGDPEVANKLRYDPTTGQLTFIGVMSPAELAFLLNPTAIVLNAIGQPVFKLDANGNPVLDQNGNPVPETQLVTLDATQQAEIQQLSSASQSATLGDQGLAVSGPGTFAVTAKNVDLGISGGIFVLPPDSALAAISPYGANISVDVSGKLDMTSTQIANEGLSDGNSSGGITLTVGGTLDVGGQFTTFGDPSFPKGIFTTGGGNVSVTVNGDVNVDGSRIATYNGGNINIESVGGDVNAGVGGEGYVNLNALELDPATGQLIGIPATIPGSGILATSVFGSHGSLGNITIIALSGSINTSQGGVIQIAFNGTDTRNNFIKLDAGQDINAKNSGIIGSNIKLQAGGNINGLVIGSQSVNVNSAQNVNVVAVSGGDVNISAEGNIAGTIVGGGSVNVSGSSIDASLISSSISASGDVSGASMGVPQSNVAKSNTETADDASTAASRNDDQTDDDPKKKNKGIALAQKVSRVTLLLPKKN